MLKNYLTIAFRNLRRRPGFAFINVAGLAAGLAACILIGLYVLDEHSYDRFHEQADCIVRVVLPDEDYAAVPPPVAPALKTDYPEQVAETVRFWPIKAPATIRHADKAFSERRVSFADPAIFDVFSFPMRAGDPKRALSAPHTMVLTASMARRYFGNENPLGQSVEFWGDAYEITGVIDDVPANTHYPFDALVSFSSLPFGGMLDNWTWAGFYTYVLLRDDASADALEAALPSFFARHTDEPISAPRLQPLTSIHLHSNLQKEVTPGGSLAYVYLLSVIAVLVLGVACINFMNLSTARSADRAREVGMRKALGAHRGQLVGQFLGESVLLSSAALLLALVLVQGALPLFNAVAGKTLALDYGTQGEAVLVFAGLALVVGLAAGSYPALYLSRFQPAGILEGQHAPTASGLPLRRGLIVFQFAVSITLFIAAVVAYQQLGFMQSKDLGFAQDNVVIVEAGNYEGLRDALRQVPEVARVSASGTVPGQRFQTLPIRTEGMPLDSTRDVRRLGLDYGFLETMGIELAAGRAFSEAQATDRDRAVVINESAAEALGWADPVGQTMELYAFSEDGASFTVAREGTVIGVTKDFNYASLHGPVEPLVLTLAQGENINQAVIRIRDGQTPAALAKIEAAWRAANPGDPFDFVFLDQQLAQQYRAEQQLGRLFGAFTALALLIAALGLFGLAAFTAEARTKEIGIRKALGASAASIVALLSKDFAKLVGIAFLVAAPVAWLAMQRWLDDFAYRITLGPGVFLGAGTAALFVAMATVSYQALKAARTNPTDALRAE